MNNEDKNILNLSIEFITNLIESHRKNAYRKINEELVTMYYEIGKYLAKKVADENWGDKPIENIAKGINNAYPNIKGFNKRGLSWYLENIFIIS